MKRYDGQKKIEHLAEFLCKHHHPQYVRNGVCMAVTMAAKEVWKEGPIYCDAVVIQAAQDAVTMAASSSESPLLALPPIPTADFSQNLRITRLEAENQELRQRLDDLQVYVAFLV